MTLEAEKEMDRRCVMDWLNEVYVTPSRAFDKYTEDELKMFAHDALVLLKEQETIVRCKDCKYWLPMNRFYPDYHPGRGQCELNCWVRDSDWFCADGERKVKRDA